jgi:hypothetical protein
MAMGTLTTSKHVQGKIETSFPSDINDIAFANSQSDNNSNCVYSLVIRNTTPTIKAGETLEIEVFISGYGIPSKNKLNIFWTSPYVIDPNNPGTIEIGGYKPIGLDPNGFITVLPSEIFSISTIIKPPPDYGLPLVRSETSLSGKYPILLKLNTSKTAPSGDYDITFVFTYSDNQSMYQSYETTQFHISSLWERNQLWITITAASIAFVSLIITTTVGIWNLNINLKKQKTKH